MVVGSVSLSCRIFWSLIGHSFIHSWLWNSHSTRPGPSLFAPRLPPSNSSPHERTRSVKLFGGKTAARLYPSCFWPARRRVNNHTGRRGKGRCSMRRHTATPPQTERPAVACVRRPSPYSLPPALLLDRFRASLHLPIVCARSAEAARARPRQLESQPSPASGIPPSHAQTGRRESTRPLPVTTGWVS